MNKYIRQIGDKYVVEEIKGFVPSNSCIVPENIDKSDYPFLRIVETTVEILGVEEVVKTVEVDEDLKASNPTLGSM